MAHLLAENIRHLCALTQVSTATLSKATGISVHVLRRLLANTHKNPTLETLQAIANYFTVTLSELIGEVALPEVKTMRKPKSQYIPLLDWAELPHLSQTSQHYISVSCAISNTAFALPISSHEWHDTHYVNAYLIIDTARIARNLDYVIVDSHHGRQIFQFIQQEETCWIKPTHQHVNEQMHIAITPQEVIGVVVQYVINYI